MKPLKDWTVLEIARCRGYLYDDERKIAYKWNCKVGCSILKYLCLMSGPRREEFCRFRSESRLNIFQALGKYFWENQLEFDRSGGSRLLSYDRVHVWRDPVSRFVSCYNFIVYRKSKQHKLISPRHLVECVLHSRFDQRIVGCLPRALCHLMPQDFRGDAFLFRRLELGSHEAESFFLSRYGSLYSAAMEEFRKVGHHGNRKRIITEEQVRSDAELLRDVIAADQVRDMEEPKKSQQKPLPHTIGRAPQTPIAGKKIQKSENNLGWQEGMKRWQDVQRLQKIMEKHKEQLHLLRERQNQDLKS